MVNEPEIILPQELVLYSTLVKNYVGNFPREIYDVKIAVVCSEEYKEVLSSWETVCQSRGLRYFVFTSFKDAVHCLTDDDEPLAERDQQAAINALAGDVATLEKNE